LKIEENGGITPFDGAFGFVVFFSSLHFYVLIKKNVPVRLFFI